MQVAVVTVGDELLAGETANTNATWLASELTDRGVSVERILTIPDDRALIADYVERWADAFDAVIATGGVGGTPDDVTMEAVADALDRKLIVDDSVRERLFEKVAALREARPELFENHEFGLDIDATASLPAGARSLLTDAGFAPGCVIANVYVFAGFPEEMKAAFERVADEFSGERLSQSILTSEPEGSVQRVLEPVAERFDVSVGSYPTKGNRPGKLRVTGTDAEEISAAVDWLRERIETVE